MSQLTIELENIGGEMQYIPPPLPKGEILTGIAAFLENDVYRKRPRELDLYGPYQNQEELKFDLLGGPLRTVRALKTARSKRPDISLVDQSQDSDLNRTETRKAKVKKKKHLTSTGCMLLTGPKRPKRLSRRCSIR